MFGVPLRQQCEVEHILVSSHFSLAVRDSGTAAGGSRHSVQNTKEDEHLCFDLYTLTSGDLVQTSGSCLLLSR